MWPFHRHDWVEVNRHFYWFQSSDTYYGHSGNRTMISYQCRDDESHWKQRELTGKVTLD